MSVQHPDVVTFAVPENRMDQIVDIVTGSFSVGAATDDGFGGITPLNVSDSPKPVLADDFFYTRGLWSIDGGSSWQEMGTAIPAGTAAISGFLTLSVSTNCYQGQLVVSASNQGLSSHTVQYKVLVMARFDQEYIGKKALVRPLRYSSKEKYMKVFKEGKVALPTSGTTTIAHNLGYVPNVMAWILFDETPAGFPNEKFLFESGSTVSVDNHNIYIAQNSFAGVADETAYYRIYLDA